MLFNKGGCVMLFVQDIVLGFFSGILFVVLIYVADLTATKFYSKSEEEYDNISVRTPSILFMIISLCLLTVHTIVTALSFVLVYLIYLFFTPSEKEEKYEDTNLSEASNHIGEKKTTIPPTVGKL